MVNVSCFGDAARIAVSLGAKFCCKTNINGHVIYTFVKDDKPLTVEEANAITSPLYTVLDLGGPSYHEVGYYSVIMESFTHIDRVNGQLLPREDHKQNISISGVVPIPEYYFQ